MSDAELSSSRLHSVSECRRISAKPHMTKKKARHSLQNCDGLFLVPLLHQKEITDVPMLDSAPAHVKLVQRNDILREVVADGMITPKFPGNGFLRRKEVCHLNIQLLSALAAHEVDLLVHDPANGYFVASSQQYLM